MIWEEGKFYPVIKALKGNGKERLSEEEARFGPVLNKKKHPILKEYLADQWNKLCTLQEELSLAGEGERAVKRRMELQREINYVKMAAEKMGMPV